VKHAFSALIRFGDKIGCRFGCRARFCASNSAVGVLNLVAVKHLIYE
jgi:hypothetical protein